MQVDFDPRLVNSVGILGNLGQPFDLRRLRNGMSVASSTVAVKNAKKETEWCEAPELKSNTRNMPILGFFQLPFRACTLDLQLKGADCMTGSIWRCGTGWLSRQPSSSARALKFRCSLLIFYLTFLPYAWPAYIGLACNTSTVQVTRVAQLLVSHLQQRFSAQPIQWS